MKKIWVNREYSRRVHDRTFPGLPLAQRNPCLFSKSAEFPCLSNQMAHRLMCRWNFDVHIEICSPCYITVKSLLMSQVWVVSGGLPGPSCFCLCWRHYIPFFTSFISRIYLTIQLKWNLKVIQNGVYSYQPKKRRKGLRILKHHNLIFFFYDTMLLGSLVL